MTPAKQEKIAKSQVRGKLTTGEAIALIRNIKSMARRLGLEFEANDQKLSALGFSAEEIQNIKFHSCPTHSDSPTQVRNV